MKKSLIACLLVLFVLVSFGAASAFDINQVPPSVKDAYEEAFPGEKQAFAVWISAVPELQVNNWTNIAIVSNFFGTPVNVLCEFTSFSATQTFKSFALNGFEKRFVVIPNEVGSNDVFDIWCTAGTPIGLQNFLFDTLSGQVLTAIPVMWLQ